MRIWIVNNYSMPPSLGGLVRHHYFSSFLRERGHEVRIITGSQVHNTKINFSEPGKLYIEKEIDGVPYTYVRTVSYTRNNYRRIINMQEFTSRCTRVMEKLYQAGERPDIIIGSSPIPMSASRVMGFAKKKKIPFVFEVRDLWPLTLVEYGKLEKKFYTHPMIQYLYRMEHKLYAGADANIFTMHGGAEYIRDQKWMDDVDLTNIYQVNNGVDLKEFHHNLTHVHYEDPDLDDQATFKVVYMGSIRPAYNLDMILDVAKALREELPQVRFYFYGGGTELERLRDRCLREKITNAKFKGRVKKEEIPSILTRSNLNLLHNRSVSLLRYGTSNNKLFEYLAAGIPILSTANSNYSLVREHFCGLECDNQSIESIKENIHKASQWDRETRKQIFENTQNLVQEYSYRALSIKLEKILEGVLGLGPKMPSVDEEDV